MQPNYAPPVQYPPQSIATAYPGVPQQFGQPTQFPGYPPQGFPQQVQPPTQPLAQGTLDDFYNQPASGGSKALTFPIVNTRYVGIIERPITNGDIQQQTSPPAQGSVPQFFKDGRPKLTMRVPLQMQPSPEFPDGRATWFVKGADRDELARAMAEAGAPEGAPEHGAIIDVAYVSDAASGQGMNPRKVKRVAYTRPNGAAPVAAAPAQVQQPTTTPEGVAQAMAAQAAQFAAQQAAPVVYQQPIPTNTASATPPPAAPAVVPQAPVQPAAAPAPPPEMSAAQQELLAKLQGQTG